MQDDNKEILKKIENLLRLSESLKPAETEAEQFLHGIIHQIKDNIKTSADNFDLVCDSYKAYTKEEEVSKDFVPPMLAVAFGLAQIDQFTQLSDLTSENSSSIVNDTELNSFVEDEDLFNVDLTELYG